MLPEWMKATDDYAPPKDGGAFYIKTLKSLGHVMSGLKVEAGREGKHSIPALLKLAITFILILGLSLSQDRLLIMGFGAVILIALAVRKPEDIWSILKPALFAGILSAVLYVPAVIMEPVRIYNGIRLVIKIILSVVAIGIFNSTTQWNHVTRSLRKIHIPGVVIFSIDITFRFIVLLGKLMEEMLTALQLRSVGRNNKKYNSVGGIMGMTFVRGTEMNTEMYEAMQCRGFTDDYEGL